MLLGCNAYCKSSTPHNVRIVLLNFRKQSASALRELSRDPWSCGPGWYFFPYNTKLTDTWLNTFGAESPDPIYAVRMVGVWIDRGGWSVTWISPQKIKMTSNTHYQRLLEQNKNITICHLLHPQIYKQRNQTD